jgi:hypothetical protein
MLFEVMFILLCFAILLSRVGLRCNGLNGQRSRLLLLARWQPPDAATVADKPLG